MADQQDRRASSPSVSRQNNLTRIGRQLTRGLIPALRNLVRTRRQSRSSTRDAELAAVPEDVNMSEAVSAQNILQSEAPSVEMQSSSPSIPNLMDNVDNVDNTEPLIQSPSLTSSESNDPTAPTAEEMDITERINNAIAQNLNSLLSNTLPALPALPSIPGLSNLLSGIPGNADVQDPASPSSNPPDARQRYRLVVYFEERSQEEQPTTRYVAVIVGRLDELQNLLSAAPGATGATGNEERNFSDLLNHLFQQYAPKGTPPAKQDIIDTLPTVTIDENSEQSCMVCLEKFEPGTKAVILPCNHQFHGDECVKTWLKLHNSCPICRYELPVEDADYEKTRKERMIARGFSHEGHSHPISVGGEDSCPGEVPESLFHGDANM